MRHRQFADVAQPPGRARAWLALLRSATMVTLLAVASGCGSSAATRDDAAATSDGGSCVELLTTETLAGRSFAFDGVVRSVTPAEGVDLDADPNALPSYPVAEFDVSEWFAGDGGDSVAVKMQREVVPGQRLLVSGESLFGDDPLGDPIAWECGFTTEHSDDTAAIWESAW